MRTRQVVTATITLALGFILGALTWQPSFAQRKAEEAPKVESVGRYQFSLVSCQSQRDRLYTMDTATGQVWIAGDKGWEDVAGPIPARKK
jgi:hypothetical protein